MKRLVVSWGLLLLLTELSIAMTPQEALKKADEAIFPSNVTYTGEMTIYRPNKEYTKALKVYIKGRDKSLIEFLSPPKERGTKLLLKEDYVWMYLPSVEKIIRLAGKTSLVGGDFTHDDILRIRLAENYEAISMNEEENCYVLELKAKSKNISYGKIMYYVNKKNFLPIKCEFYVLGDRLFKTLTYQEPKIIKGRLMHSILIMENAFTKDYKTIMKLKDASFEHIPDRIFTQEYLSKGL